MLDRSDCKEMWVWDGDTLCNPKEKKRIIVDICNDGVVSVDDNYITDFKRSLTFDTSVYDHCEEIKEPKKRLMTQNEVLGFITHNPHIVVKYNGDLALTYWFIYTDIENYQYASIDEKGNIGEWSKFEVEE